MCGHAWFPSSVRMATSTSECKSGPSPVPEGGEGSSEPSEPHPSPPPPPPPLPLGTAMDRGNNLVVVVSALVFLMADQVRSL